MRSAPFALKTASAWRLCKFRSTVRFSSIISVAIVGAVRPTHSEKTDASHQPEITARIAPSVRKTGATHRARMRSRLGCIASPARKSAGQAVPGRCPETSTNECTANATPHTIAAVRIVRSVPDARGRHCRIQTANAAARSTAAGQPISTAIHSQSLSGWRARF